MWPPAAVRSSAASMFMVSSVLLFEIAPHHGEQPPRGASLFRFRLSVRIDHVKTNMAFKALGPLVCEIFDSDYSQTASNASQNSCRFVQDRAHAANDYDLRDAFEQYTRS